MTSTNVAPGAPVYDVLRELLSQDELRRLIASLGNLRHLPGPERTEEARELLRQLLAPDADERGTNIVRTPGGEPEPPSRHGAATVPIVSPANSWPVSKQYALRRQAR